MSQLTYKMEFNAESREYEISKQEDGKFVRVFASHWFGEADLYLHDNIFPYTCSVMPDNEPSSSVVMITVETK